MQENTNTNYTKDEQNNKKNTKKQKKQKNTIKHEKIFL